jgi:uncharacterized protein (DUF2235 family)
MGKNVVIFADGTGQRGGVLFDEARTNIFKLYRATRCGPDSNVDPARQLTFYDPGIGTVRGGVGLLGAVRDWVYNKICQATGLGLTRNMVDCYAAIIQMCWPDDNIFLFGFSRGAFTVRCLSGVLALCGVPTQEDGQDLKRDPVTAKRIAKEAVKTVYQYTSSVKDTDATPKQKVLLDERRALARQFREKYSSNNENGEANKLPYFIGAFDTVASLADTVVLVMLSVSGAAILAIIAWVLHFWTLSFSWWFGTLALGTAIGCVIAYLGTHLRAFTLGPRWGGKIHLTEPRMTFHDRDLNRRVGFARHAISIDEDRSRFPHEYWGDPRDDKGENEPEPKWFVQKWFAGNHADIGGGYPENESRLSDIALDWMVTEAEKLGLLIDPLVLRRNKSAAGMQHDERKSSLFKYAGRYDRKPPHGAPLHDTVLERFEVGKVLHYDDIRLYRPECLRHHDIVGKYYTHN